MTDEPSPPAPAPANEPPRDIAGIISAVRAATIPGSPIARDAACLGHFDRVFIPALTAALKGA